MSYGDGIFMLLRVFKIIIVSKILKIALRVKALCAIAYARRAKPLR